MVGLANMDSGAYFVVMADGQRCLIELGAASWIMHASASSAVAGRWARMLTLDHCEIGEPLVATVVQDGDPITLRLGKVVEIRPITLAGY